MVGIDWRTFLTAHEICHRLKVGKVRQDILITSKLLGSYPLKVMEVDQTKNILFLNQKRLRNQWCRGGGSTYIPFHTQRGAESMGRVRRAVWTRHEVIVVAYRALNSVLGVLSSHYHIMVMTLTRVMARVMCLGTSYGMCHDMMSHNTFQNQTL